MKNTRVSRMGNSMRLLLVRFSLWMLAASVFVSCTHAQAVCDAQKYGARADGTTVNTAALQRALDDCAQKQGTVRLAGGVFVSGPLTLRSDVTLEIAAGSTLRGSRNLDDYPIRKDAPWRRVALLHADNVSHLRITGGGVIDGSGDVFWEMARTHRIVGDTSGSGGYPRPMLVDITESQKIQIDHIQFQNSPMYNLAFFFCDGLLIDHVVIRNPATGAPNTDGIDPFSSKNVEISHVDIDTGDDDIALKSGLVERDAKIGPLEHVYIHDSIFRHGHGLSVGSELAGGIHDLRVEDVVMENTDAGVRIKCNRTRGNDIYDLHYKNIRMTNVGQPIQITEYYPKWPPSRTDKKKPVDAHTPRFHKISLEDITATGAKDAVIVGLPEMLIRDLVLNNVSIESEKGLLVRNAQVVMRNVKIHAAAGPAIIREEEALLDTVKYIQMK